MDVDAQETGAVAAQIFIELDLNTFSTATYYPAAYQRQVGRSTAVVNASCYLPRRYLRLYVSERNKLLAAAVY